MSAADPSAAAPAAAPLELPPLGFGAAQLGNLYRATTDEEADGAVRAAWDVGIRYFDTAPHYGIGTSERRQLTQQASAQVLERVQKAQSGGIEMC